jgi:hypothetical protein
MNDNTDIKKRTNVQEYSSYYFVTGEDNPDNDRNNSTEGIQKIEDHSVYYLVDKKNKGERIKIKKIHCKNFFDEMGTCNNTFLSNGNLEEEFPMKTCEEEFLEFPM